MVKENKIYLRPCTLGFELANSHEHNIERKIMNGGELNPFGSSLDDGQWNGKTTQTANSSEKITFSQAQTDLSAQLSPVDVDCWGQLTFSMAIPKTSYTRLRCDADRQPYEEDKGSLRERIYMSARKYCETSTSTSFFSHHFHSFQTIFTSHTSHSFRRRCDLMSVFSLFIYRLVVVMSLHCMGRSHTLQMGRRAHRIKITAQIV